MVLRTTTTANIEPRPPDPPAKPTRTRRRLRRHASIRAHRRQLRPYRLQLSLPRRFARSMLDYRIRQPPCEARRPAVSTPPAAAAAGEQMQPRHASNSASSDQLGVTAVRSLTAACSTIAKELRLRRHLLLRRGRQRPRARAKRWKPPPPSASAPPAPRTSPASCRPRRRHVRYCQAE